VVSKEEAADSEIAEVVEVVTVAEDVIPADAVPSAIIARTTVATVARMIRVDREDKAVMENLVRVPMNLPSLFPDLPEPRLWMDLRPSRPTPRGLSKSPARASASSARRSAPTPPLRTTSSSPPR
jgi:hypothetical protein